ncbi:Deoxyhypusine hydroxylase [Astathelohania contejeani]|uniref:Deoxyhypusine hydroxylase n=1 Tax=Astathelohania contejeani TaxID=164912 RepID=A0ABQ7I0B3_9MICR|nr:Deoxyhypusine hydroxylase [Thelohania contejeani]
MQEETGKAFKILTDKNETIAARMRALFYLRNSDDPYSAKCIEGAFDDESVLLKHEAAYVLGQKKDSASMDVLRKVLKNENEDEVVRHEAAEALGNYLDSSNLPLLDSLVGHSSAPVSETCYIAACKIREGMKTNYPEVSSFDSRDPAFPLKVSSLEEAKRIFLNPKSCLYQRYKAMFWLRDAGEAEVLCEGFSDESALFKHEIAFVLGQMRDPRAVEVLGQVMADPSEHGMVRHESAEALGAIGTKRCHELLTPFLNSQLAILRESVEVALDIHAYENSNELEYCKV